MNFKNAPYHDNYDKSKQFVKYLAVGGRYAQTREFTEIQTMFLDFLKGLGDSVFKDGNRVEGCEITKDGNNISISPGRIYLNGLVRSTTGGKVSIQGTGEEFIGCKIIETVVTAEDDESLLDPDITSASYLHKGCDRLKQDVVFVANDPLSAPICKFKDGTIVSLVQEAPQADVMSEMLARRTYDESGNYVVHGMNLKNGEHSDGDNLLVTLEKGKAYIKGFEVNKPADTSFYVKKSLTTRGVTGEPKIFDTLNTSYRLFKFPVKQVHRVLTTVETQETMNRGAIGGTTDTLSNINVTEIVEVKQSGTTYTPGSDFLLTENRIDWSPGGKEPVTGTNYTVKYRYKKVLEEGTDYRVASTNTQTNVNIIANNVVPKAEILIDYDFYLARKDTVCLDAEGNIIVVEGEPDEINVVNAPIITDRNILKMGTVCVTANDSTIYVLSNTVKVSTMERIQATIDRVSTLERNLTLTDLDREVEQGEPPTDMRGIFTDGFLNMNKIDLTYPNVTFTMDVVEGRLLLPHTESKSRLNAIQGGTSKYMNMLNILCCPYRETLLASQLACTQSYLINPYAVFRPVMNVSLDPDTDNWVDESKVTIEKVNTTTHKLHRWWLHSNDPWAEAEKRQWEALGFSSDMDGWGTVEGIVGDESNSWLGINYKEHQTGASYEKILDEAVTYIRQRTVEIFSKTFPFNEDNIECTFDGRPVVLTPKDTTKTGTKAGSVQADSNGVVKATFEIPEGVPTGTKEVKLFSPNFEGVANYTASGRKIVIQETIYKERVEVHAVDPLAETFQLTEDRNITSLDLYFAEKDGAKTCSVQLRNVVNGYPGNVVYGECVLSGSEINADPVGNTPTKCKFDNVIKCEKNTQYCFVVLTDSNIMKLHVAKLGERDTVNGQYVTSQAYVEGVMFSSSNAITWTAHQDMDIKFSLYGAQYEETGLINFATTSLSQADRVMLAIESVTPMGCTCSFEVSLDGGKYVPYLPYIDRLLNMNASTADVRIKMTSNGVQSPLVNADTSSIVSFKNDLQTCYVSRTIPVHEGYNTVKVYMDVLTQASTKYKVFYSTNPTADVWTEIESPEITQLTSSMQENFYKATLKQPAKTFRIKVTMETSASYNRPIIRKLRCSLTTLAGEPS